ncbi:hypothetical protein MB02_13905 [Croceicoccus estronivorus]|uniref:YdcF family protein n=1 Tax=Croceicoccus estronivorus TaxID=1172626 RepID=UPI000836B174|nr:YdcF family protein [Croceicoccus estronivorus]OCC22867.1 hypothetical protein MB02_13905 [Croceicoccus estronivorus]
MIRRILAALFLLWAFGFLWFAVALPAPAGMRKTDAIVVPTGSRGRIDRGLTLLRARQAKKMLVTGVDPEVKPREFAAEYKVEQRLMNCCITLGSDAVDTRGNAQETAQWVARNGVKSVRLVTADWHMRRAAAELGQELPESVAVLRDAVPSQPSMRTLFLEYNKLLASQAVRLWDVFA